MPLNEEKNNNNNNNNNKIDAQIKCQSCGNKMNKAIDRAIDAIFSK